MALCLLAVAVPCILTVAAGVPALHNGVGVPDTFIQLDGAYRMLQGQRPHIDFYSAMGTLVYVLPALGLKLAHGRPIALAYSSAMAGVVFGCWCAVLCSKRASIWCAVLLTLFVTVLTVASFPLGESYWDNSYGSQYNRFGYAMAGLVLLESYLPVGKQRDAAASFLSGLSSGVLIALAFFLKATYCAAGLALFCASLLLRRKNGERLAGAITGAAAVSAALLFYLRFDVTAVFRDLAIAGGVRSAFDVTIIPRVFLANAPELLVLAACFYVFSRLGLPRLPEDRLQAKYFYPVLLFISFACELVLLATNTQRYGCVLAGFLFFALLARVETQVAPSGAPALAAVMLFVTAGTLAFAMETVSAALHGAKHRRITQSTPGFVPFEAPVLNGLVVAQTNASLAPWNYTTLVNEGLHLLAHSGPPNARIVCLCFSNPFPYALQYPSANGGATALIRDFTFNGSHFPAPGRLIGDADTVIVEDERLEPFVAGLEKIAGPVLSRDFHVAGESPHWKLYRRK